MSGTATQDAVTTNSGRVSGLARNGHLAFFGIPYARAKRFGAPEAAAPLSGVKEATAIGLAAPQPPHPVAGFAASGPQGEDCLNLNIFTPACDGGKRPVMVWVHGGGFTHGAGYEPLYNGGPLAMRGDVVVVTINYRLGALGFLRLPEIDAPGNQGLLDQIAALQWVRDNIASFGGDPARVTIFGQSAGSASVACLLAMPPARGLFRRAILQSGAGRAATPETSDRIAQAMLELLGISRGKEADLLTLAPDAILKAQGLIGSKLGAEARFNPVIDPAVLPATPIDAIAGGAARDTEIVIGTNRDEIKQFVAMMRREPIDDVELLAQVRATLPKAGASEAQEAIGVYRASRKAHQLPHDNLDILDAVVTDSRFRIPSIRLAQGQCAAGGKAWMYLFTHPSPARRGALGACHSVEMPFVFGTLDAPTQDRFAGTGPDVERLSRQMMDAWLGFSRDGAPDHESIAPWSPYDARSRPTMIFGTKASTQRPDPFAEERRIIEPLI
ncbi:MAG: carboxylesterase/lipase family protein [Xanthobacteraceae bacterium]